MKNENTIAFIFKSPPKSKPGEVIGSFGDVSLRSFLKNQ
jgi:hypothetical protein